MYMYCTPCLGVVVMTPSLTWLASRSQGHRPANLSPSSTASQVLQFELAWAVPRRQTRPQEALAAVVLGAMSAGLFYLLYWVVDALAVAHSFPWWMMALDLVLTLLFACVAVSFRLRRRIARPFRWAIEIASFVCTPVRCGSPNPTIRLSAAPAVLTVRYVRRS